MSNTPQPLAGKRFHFTGSFALNPKHHAEQLGAQLLVAGKPGDSIEKSDGVDCVVAGSGPSRIRIEQAKALGIPVLDEEGFLQTFAPDIWAEHEARIAERKRQYAELIAEREREEAEAKRQWEEFIARKIPELKAQGKKLLYYKGEVAGYLLTDEEFFALADDEFMAACTDYFGEDDESYVLYRNDTDELCIHNASYGYHRIDDDGSLWWDERHTRANTVRCLGTVELFQECSAAELRKVLVDTDDGRYDVYRDVEDELEVFDLSNANYTVEGGDHPGPRNVTTTPTDEVALAKVQLSIALAGEARCREALDAATEARVEKERILKKVQK